MPSSPRRLWLAASAIASGYVLSAALFALLVYQVIKDQQLQKLPQVVDVNLVEEEQNLIQSTVSYKETDYSWQQEEDPKVIPNIISSPEQTFRSPGNKITV